MHEIAPDGLSERLEANGDDVVVLDIRHREEYEDWHIPDHPPNFERVKRVNVGEESVAEDELGPNNCAAE